MNKPDGYDEAEVKEFGEYEALPVGNYTCKIVKAEVGETATRKEKLTLFLDIAEGEHRGFFKKQYDSDTRDNKKWGCQYVQLTQDTSVKYFKAMVTSIEKSNKGFTFNFDEKTLANKFVGGQFGAEEYMKQEGGIGRSVKCRYLRSLEGLEKAKVLEDKLLDPMKSATNNATKKANEQHFASMDEDTEDCPF